MRRSLPLVHKSLSLAIASVAVVGLAAAATIAAGATAATTTTLSITGPWQGVSEKSFQAVLANFEQRNPGVDVTYTAAPKGVVPAIDAAVTAGKAPDVAVLSLPGDLAGMKRLARAGTLEPIEFAVPAVRANFAYSWKLLGSVDSKLYGLFVKATNDSAFWYPQQRFRSAGVTAPSSWRQLQRITGVLAKGGPAPFAVSGASGFMLPNLFQNAYLMLQGSKRYDMLAQGKVQWTNGTVKDTLTTMRGGLANPAWTAGGVASLSTRYPAAIQRVFGSPSTASMIAGGSAAMPVLYNARAVRPLSQFGVFPFPTTDGKGPPRVIGTADAVVMLTDTPAARALISFLATPEAATIWAQRATAGFLSPNRKVDVSAYPTATARTLATALTQASVFRFGIAEARSPAFTQTMSRLLGDYVRNPGVLDQVTTQLQAAFLGA